MEKKVTKRNVLDVLVAAVDAGDIVLDTYGDVTAEDVRNYAVNEIALLDKRAERAKERAAKTKAEGDELTEVLYEALGADFEPIPDILARIEGEDITAAKIAVRLKRLADDGRAERSEIKVKAADGGKSRTLVAYRKA